jgi:dipeptidyl aminopeptidase/acylaminoacyl peptidase
VRAAIRIDEPRSYSGIWSDPTGSIGHRKRLLHPVHADPRDEYPLFRGLIDHVHNSCHGVIAASKIFCDSIFLSVKPLRLTGNMREGIIGAVAAICCLSSPSSAQQEVKLAPEIAFGARERVQSIALSPDGSMFSYVAPYGDRGDALYTVKLAGDGTPVRTAVTSGDPERLGGCGWVSNERLVCKLYSLQRVGGELFGASRLIGINANGSNLKVISRPAGENARYASAAGGSVLDWLPGQTDKVLLTSYFVPQGKTGTLVSRDDEGYGVERVDTGTLSRERIVKPLKDAIEFITDGRGDVRLVGLQRAVDAGYATGEIAYLYRSAGSSTWKTFDSYIPLTREGFNPYAVNPERNVVYGLKKKDGRLALYTRTLDDTQTETLILARPDVDVDGLIQIGRQKRIVGATYATERRIAEYFDPDVNAMVSALHRALPNAATVDVVEASEDGRKMLILAASDTDPGRYFFFDRDAKALRPLLLDRPELGGMKLATVKSITVQTSNGVMIPAYLTLPVGSTGRNLPTIVMPHGGPSARDEWGFDWLPQYFANRGFAVLQPNFRGSSGYGDGWFGANGFRDWRVAIGDVVDSGRWLVQQGIADPAKLAVVGWSYGGYAALQSGVVAPDLFKAIIAVAPVTDITELRDSYQRTSAANEVNTMMGNGPDVVQGSPARNAAAIKAPVLLFHGTFDQNVPYRQSRLMDDRLKDAGKRHDLVTYDGLDHGLRDAKARADMLKRSNAFLRAAMGM